MPAVSIASDPPEAKNTVASAIGAIAAIRSARRTVVSVVYAPNEEYAASRRSWSATASAIDPRPKPTLQYHSDAVESR